MREYFTNMAAFKKRYHSAVIYHRRAEQFADERQPLIVIFDVASIAVENYLIALCEFYKIDPRIHNYQALIGAVEQISAITIPLGIIEQVKALDEAYGICSVENYHRKTEFTNDEIGQVLYLCHYFNELSEQNIILGIKS